MDCVVYTVASWLFYQNVMLGQNLMLTVFGKSAMRYCLMWHRHRLLILRFMLAPLLLGSSVTDGGQIALEEYIKRLQLSGIVCHILFVCSGTFYSKFLLSRLLKYISWFEGLYVKMYSFTMLSLASESRDTYICSAMALNH